MSIAQERDVHVGMTQELTVYDGLGADPAAVWNGSDWRDFAACKGRTELFFGKKAERPEARARREARAARLCAECPVGDPCRAYARENREYGYWAGESEEDRHVLGFTVCAPIGIRARQTSLAS